MIVLSIQLYLSTAATSRAFASTAIASMPFGVWFSVTVCSAWVYVRGVLAPRFASSMAIPLPIPHEPPVTIAFFPLRDILVVASGCGR